MIRFFVVGLLAAAAVQGDDQTPLQEFSKGYKQFTADIYKELAKKKDGNFLVSPLSVEVVLALDSQGARGKTFHELTSALRLPEDKEKIKQIFQEVALLLKGNDDYVLSSANKIYVKDGLSLDEEFKKTAVEVFSSEVQNIDFGKPTAADEINQWVESKTDHKIKDLLSKQDLQGPVAAVLINALYFQGKWVTQFDEAKTAKKPFHALGSDVEVDMMTLTENFNYYEDDKLNAKFLQMPYKGNEVVLTIVLPNNVAGLKDLEEHIEEVIADNHPYINRRVRVEIPKFKSETNIDFIPILKSLGAIDPFEDSADFSDLHPIVGKISKIIQKTFIEVDEKGTKAAAATAVMHLYRTALNLPLEFTADHPFIYYLRSPAGVFFVGRYVNNQ